MEKDLLAPRPRKQGKSLEIVNGIRDLFFGNGFIKVFALEEKEGGYVISNLNSEFKLWIDINNDELIVKDFQIANNNNGVGRSLINNIKEVCRDQGYVRIIANKVKSNAWDFWIQKCGFEVDIENRDNAVFDLVRSE